MVRFYIVVTALAAAATFYAALNDFIRPEWLCRSMSRLGVPDSWLPRLAALKIAGAIGLLAGIGVRAIGIAAAIGLVLFFVGAIVTAIRARWYAHIPLPMIWLLLAGGSLALRIVT